MTGPPDGDAANRGTNFGRGGCCRLCGIAKVSREPLWRRPSCLLVSCSALPLCLVGATSLALAEDYAGGAIKSAETSAGEILTDANGMTLYTFDKDTAGTSNCYDECAVNWPPLIAAAGAAADDEYTLVERKDGTMQWAYDGKPLYLWKRTPSRAT